MGILSGLSDLGLSKLEGAELYGKSEAKAPKVEEKKPEVEKKVNTEKDYIYAKSFECPVCQKEFKDFVVKTGKARMVKQDRDLRPIFSGIDTIKYDIISCPNCGYSSLARTFSTIAGPQIKLIKENICKNFRKFPRHDIITYDEAIDRFRLALANTIVKKGKDSEKAYLCLRMAWVVRGKAQDTVRGDVDYEKIMAELKDDENELLHNALEGFVSARASEHFPIAGMDEMTLDYLMAVLFINEKDYNNAAKLVYDILNSKTASSRLKEKARDLKDEILNRDK